MATLATPPAKEIRTVADLVERLGGVPLDRIRLRPLPGAATEQDVLDLDDHEDRLCELVDGVLVEKAMGYEESALACCLIELLGAYVRPRNLGIVTGEAGMVRLFPGLVHIPDVAYASWNRFPEGRRPKARIPSLAPDLVVEVLSPSNTPAEMARKRREYFDAGVRLLWEVDPKARTAAVYTTPDRPTVLGEDHTLDRGDVLPGFSLPLAQLFAELDRQANI